MPSDVDQKEVQLKLRFRDDLRKKLTAAGERNGSSLNSEIVRRLEDSFAIEETRGGPATASLVQAIVADIAEIEALTGKAWSTDNETYAAVRRAVIAAIMDRPPLWVENDDEARHAHQEVLEHMKALNIAYRIRDGGGLVGSLGGGKIDPAVSEAFQREIAARIPEAEAELKAAQEVAERAYEPQRAAERRGRKIFSEIRAARKGAKSIRKPL